MPKPTIILGETEAERLLPLAENIATPRGVSLLEELERADVRPDADVPPGVAGMNALIAFAEGPGGAARTVRLVYPGEADIEQGKVSVTTPIGAALLGLSAGQSISWTEAGGRQRELSVLSVERAPLDA